MTHPPGEPASATPTVSSSRRSRLRRLVLELGVAGLGYGLLTRCQTTGLLSDGEPAPGFDTSTVTGEPVFLEQFSGGPILLHFWATWCGVCRQEFGALNALQDELVQAQTGATGEQHSPRLLTLAADDDTRALAAFVREHGLRYPVALAPPELLRRYKVHAFPTTYYIGADQTVRASTVGMSSRWAMKARLSCAAR